MRRTLLLGAALAALGLVAAGNASARALRGTVVHHNRRAHSFVVASSTGRLVAVHARRSPRVGSLVRVGARRLRNGTYAARSIRVSGSRRHVRLRGTVTYSSRSAGAFVVSARGVSLLVRRAATGRRAAAADDLQPGEGENVEVEADVDDHGDLEATDVRDNGEDQGTVDIEGVVQQVSGRQLTLSADDDDQSGGSIVVILPASFDPSAFHVGDEVELVATRNPDGTFTAVRSSGDDNEAEADRHGDDQGDSGDRRGGDD